MRVNGGLRNETPNKFYFSEENVEWALFDHDEFLVPWLNYLVVHFSLWDYFCENHIYTPFLCANSCHFMFCKHCHHGGNYTISERCMIVTYEIIFSKSAVNCFTLIMSLYELCFIGTPRLQSILTGVGIISCCRAQGKAARRCCGPSVSKVSSLVARSQLSGS